MARARAQRRPSALWGLCQGSGANPYQTCVDLTEPAYRCSCPSRKFPCKHALGLMLLWAGGGVPETAPPAWGTEWLGSRTAREAKAQAVRDKRTADPATAAKREKSVDAGVDELATWLLRRVAAMTAAGVQVIVLLALSDDGAPSYDHENAAALAAMGVPAFACTAFPDLMAAAIGRQPLQPVIDRLTSP